MQSSKGIWEWDIVKWITIVIILLTICNFLIHGFHEESVRIVIAGTARMDVLLFCLAFGSTSLHQLVKSSFTFWLMMNRKYWGISFAGLHYIHLLFLIVLQYHFHPVFTRAATFALFAGSIAYVFITLMLLTSFDFFAKLISRKAWKTLHFVGGHWIWGVFMSSYWKRVFRGEIGFLPFGVLLVVVMGIRLYSYYSTRRKLNIKNG